MRRSMCSCGKCVFDDNLSLNSVCEVSLSSLSWNVYQFIRINDRTPPQSATRVGSKTSFKNGTELFALISEWITSSRVHNIWDGVKSYHTQQLPRLICTYHKTQIIEAWKRKESFRSMGHVDRVVKSGAEKLITVEIELEMECSMLFTVYHVLEISKYMKSIDRTFFQFHSLVTVIAFYIHQRYKMRCTRHKWLWDFTVTVLLFCKKNWQWVTRFLCQEQWSNKDKLQFEKFFS